MFIKSIHLKNFGNVKDQTLVFSNGINMFCGNNGEGKSTVLRAFALLLLNETQGNLSDYIRWGCEEEGFAISTEFIYLQKEYTVEFEYSKKKSLRTVTDLLTGESYNNSSAIEFLNQLIDFKRAKASIISFENEIDLITTSPAERREYLKGIYDLNFRAQLTSIENDLTTARDKSVQIKYELEALKSQTFDKLVLSRRPFSEEVYDSTKKLKAELAEAVSILQQQLNESKDLEIQIKKKEIELYDSSKSIEDLEKEIKTLEKERKELEDKLVDFEGFALEPFYEKKEKEATDLLTKKKDLEYRLEVAEASLLNLLEPKIDLNIKNNLKDLESSLSQLRYKIPKEREEYDTLKTGICPTCGSKLEVSDLEQRKQTLEKDIEEKLRLEEEIETLEKELAKFEKETKEFTDKKDSYLTEMSNSKNYLSKVNSDLSIIDSRIQNEIDSARLKWESSFNALENELAKKINQLDSKKSKEGTEQSKIESLSSELKRLESKFDKILEIQATLATKKSSLLEVEEKIESYDSIELSNQEKTKINEELERKEKERDKKVQDLANDLFSYQEQETKAALAKKILSKEFPSFVISRMITSLKNYVNEFLAKVYPIYSIDLVENKNSLRVLYGPSNSDVKMASGFEQQIFSFAWKYALGKIQNYGLLMLDEVDSAASSENSEKFYNTLAKMDEYFQQIFVVSHKPEIQELLANDYKANVYNVEKGVYTKL